ncbi:MAG: hypothetical protein QX197_11855 [Methylococcaceae bacterium]
MKNLLIEMKGFDTVAGVEKTLFFCLYPFVPFSPSDSLRPNQFYKACLTGELAGVPRYMYGSGRTYGRTSNNGVYFTLDNSDNSLDYLMQYSFDGREVTQYSGEIGMPFSAYIKVLTGSIEAPEFSFSKSNPSQIKFVLRDKWALFNVPIAVNYYSGTNVGATGNDGTVDDLKGKSKPVCLGGTAYNVPGAPCNTSGLRWQVHDGVINDVPAAYIDGVAQTKVAGTPGAAQYAVDVSTGIVTLGSSPAGGQVTFDVQGAKFGGVWVTKCGDLVREIALNYGGRVLAEINVAAITALNSAVPAALEYYLDAGSGSINAGAPSAGTTNTTTASGTTISQLLDDLLNSVGAYGFFDRNGVLQVGRIVDPTGLASVKTFVERDFDDFQLMASGDDDKGIPVFQVAINHTANYTIQSKVAGAVLVARQAWLKLNKRTETRRDNTVKTAHKLSPQITRDSHLTSSTDAITEGDRVLTLKKVQRWQYKAIIDFYGNETLDLGMCITVIQGRLLLSAGKKFVITGITDHAPLQSKMNLELWG